MDAPEPRWLAAAATATGVVNRVAARLSGLLVVCVVSAIVYDVFCRYALDAPTIWALDFARFALVYIFFLALSPALESGHHVTVDLADRFLPLGGRRAKAVLASVLTIVFGAVLLWQVSRLTAVYVRSGQLSMTLVPVRLEYVFAVAPLGTVLFLFTALVQLARHLRGPAARDGEA